MREVDRAFQAGCAERVRDLIGLDTQLVGVLLQGPQDDGGSYAEWHRVERHRHCLEELRRFYKDDRVWSRVKEAMIAEGKITAGKKSAKEVDER